MVSKEGNGLTWTRPKGFEGKRVVVVGLGITGADISTSMVGYAKEVYVSHRTGAYIVRPPHLSLLSLRDQFILTGGPRSRGMSTASHSIMR